MGRSLSQFARTEMVRAAREIIATDGVAACTVDEVARRSGVAKTTIYRHFGTSEALVLASVDQQINSIDPVDTGSLRGDLQVIVSGYLAAARIPTSRKVFTWMLTRSMDDPEFAERFRRVRVQPRGPTVIALQRAMARGEIDPAIPIDTAIHIVQGPFVSKRIIADQEVDERELDQLLDMIVRALQKPQNTAVGLSLSSP